MIVVKIKILKKLLKSWQILSKINQDYEVSLKKILGKLQNILMIV